MECEAWGVRRGGCGVWGVGRGVWGVGCEVWGVRYHGDAVRVRFEKVLGMGFQCWEF